MRKENLNRHNGAISARYGIKEVESFRRAARRYECRLSWLNELQCDNERLYKWAGCEAEKVEAAARRNLAKYCRNYKLFAKELYINSDPRGYALKLRVKDAPMSFRRVTDQDFGGFYIIAPELC